MKSWVMAQQGKVGLLLKCKENCLLFLSYAGGEACTPGRLRKFELPLAVIICWIGYLLPDGVSSFM